LAGRFDPRRLVREVLTTGPFAQWARVPAVPGALLVGDAADFFDPFTGQGIHTALRGAELVAESLIPGLTDPGRKPGVPGVGRASDRARRRLSGPDRSRRGPPGATPRPRGSCCERDREHRPGEPRARSERSRPTVLVTMHGVDPSQFRQLLGRFATGVTVVTTRDQAGKPIGMTASSV